MWTGSPPGETLSLSGDLDLDNGDRDVMIVDDIIDTGRALGELTARAGTEVLATHNNVGAEHPKPLRSGMTGVTTPSAGGHRR